EFANLARCESQFWWHRGMEEILHSILHPIAEARDLAEAVEVGCGTGHMASRMEQHYGWRVFPTDLQREGLMFGWQYGLRRMAQADISALPFADGRFDVAVSLDVIAHFSQGHETNGVRELARVLAP